MTHLIETSNGEVFEVTDLIGPDGEPVRSALDAVCMVVKLDEDHWQVLEIGCGKVHRLQ